MRRVVAEMAARETANPQDPDCGELSCLTRCRRVSVSTRHRLGAHAGPRAAQPAIAMRPDRTAAMPATITAGGTTDIPRRM